ncbi:MAG TPA: protein kinase, partial [Pirellulales bacterium]
DFGLVRVQSLSHDGNRLTGVGTIAGTPAFMSPEQAADATDVDSRSDIYSLGAVAYFLLIGRPPFIHANSVETMAAHLSEQVVSPRRLNPEIPCDLDEVIMRCMEKDAGRRFQDLVAVDDALARCACSSAWSVERAADWWRGRTLAPAERHAHDA